MTTVRSRDTVKWCGDELHLWSGAPLLRIVKDAHFPSMWRVVLPDGRISDMANKTRAKDAAEHIALDLLADGKGSARGGRLCGQSQRPGVGAGFVSEGPPTATVRASAGEAAA